MIQLQHQGGSRDWTLWKHLKKSLDLAYKDEKLYWKQRSRVQWLKEGDKNSIETLVGDREQVLSSEAEIQQAVASFYSLLFTTNNPT